MTRPRPVFRTLLASCLLTLMLAATAPAQDKMLLRIVVGFPPGGSADGMARLVADALRADFSPIVVENKAGAGGRIALAALKNAKPAGQTVMVLPSGPMVLFPHLFNMRAKAWFAMFGPARLPPEALQRLEGIMTRALGQSAVREHLQRLG